MTWCERAGLWRARALAHTRAKEHAMRRLMKLMLVVVAGLCGAVASAAMGETPAILVLAGKVTEVKVSGEEKTTKTALSTALKEFTGEGLTATLKGCTELEKKEKDSNSCSEGLLTLTKIKQGALTCRSETEAGVKDAIETILVKVTALLAAEKSTTKVLEPLLIFSVFGVDGKELIWNCGGSKLKVHGKIGCLVLPGLTEITAGSPIEVLCKTKAKGVQETGTCEETKAICEELAKNPLLAALDGKTFESAAWTFHLLNLVANLNIFIDD
jgi:hypothetical protein